MYLENYLLVQTNFVDNHNYRYDIIKYSLRRNKTVSKNKYSLCKICLSNKYRLYYDNNYHNIICEKCRKYIHILREIRPYMYNYAYIVNDNSLFSYNNSIKYYEFIPFSYKINDKIIQLDKIYLILTEIIIKDINRLISFILIELNKNKLIAYMDLKLSRYTITI